MTTAPRGQQRREALLDAALACFAERGILHTGIEDVRKAAGASPSSVYHQFGGLPDVVVALLERTFERLFTHLTARVVRTRTAERAVVALVAGHVDWIVEHPVEGRFLYQATALELTPQASSALQARKAEMLAAIVQHLSPFVEARTLPRWTPLQLDVVLLGPSHEACRRWLAGAPIDERWMRSTLPRVAWRSVATSPDVRRRSTADAARPLRPVSGVIPGRR